MCQTAGGVHPDLWLVDDPLFEEHTSRFGPHPERPERLLAARRAVEASRNQLISLEMLPPRDASLDDLARAHTARYVESLDRLAGKTAELDPDTFVSPASVAAARRAAGGCIELVEHILRGPTRRGVALVRPPGHHATPDAAMGFCLVNNVAVAARAALAQGLERVAIVDWDVHHGNGTQDVFWDDPRVLYVSLHQYPLYPGTGSPVEIGAGEGEGFTANVALSQGATDGAYERAFSRVVLPLLDEYRPELLLVSAGYDAHERDALAAMRLTDRAYGWMARALTEVADRHAGGRIGVVLEGGYDLEALEGSLTATFQALAAKPAPPPGEGEGEGPPSLRHDRDVARAADALRPVWKHL